MHGGIALKDPWSLRGRPQERTLFTVRPRSFCERPPPRAYRLKGIPQFFHLRKRNGMSGSFRAVRLTLTSARRWIVLSKEGRLSITPPLGVPARAGKKPTAAPRSGTAGVKDERGSKQEGSLEVHRRNQGSSASVCQPGED